MIQGVIDIPIYRHKIEFVVCSDEEFRSNYKRETDSRKDGVFHGINYNRSLIHLKSWNNTSGDIETLTHEIFHSVNYMMLSVGIDFDPNNSEVFAFPFGYIHRKIVDIINTKQKK